MWFEEMWWMAGWLALQSYMQCLCRPLPFELEPFWPWERTAHLVTLCIRKLFRSGVPMDGCALLWRFFQRPWTEWFVVLKFSGGGVVCMSWGDALNFKAWIKTTQFKWWSHVNWLVGRPLFVRLFAPRRCESRTWSQLRCPMRLAGGSHHQKMRPGADAEDHCHQNCHQIWFKTLLKCV